MSNNVNMYLANIESLELPKIVKKWIKIGWNKLLSQLGRVRPNRAKSTQFGLAAHWVGLDLVNTNTGTNKQTMLGLGEHDHRHADTDQKRRAPQVPSLENTDGKRAEAATCCIRWRGGQGVRWWPSESCQRLAANQPQSDGNAAGNGGVPDNEHDPDGSQHRSQKLGRGGGEWFGWLTLSERLLGSKKWP